jgi:hypothetical protein
MLFQRDAKAASQHGETVLNPAFQMACQMALSQFQFLQGPMPDMSTSAAVAWKLQGAREFLNVLLSLHDKPTAQETKKNDGLNYDA